MAILIVDVHPKSELVVETYLLYFANPTHKHSQMWIKAWLLFCLSIKNKEEEREEQSLQSATQDLPLFMAKETDWKHLLLL